MTSSIAVRHLPGWVVNGIAVTLGLALVQCSIGLAAGAQAAIATAVCASLADVVATTDRVARRVLAAVIASTASGTLFLLVRPHEAWLIPAVALVVFGAMLIQSWGAKAGTVSFAAGLALVFAMSLPASQPLTWERFAWGLAGSVGYWIWAVATARLLQPTWRHVALAASAQDLGALLTAIARQIGHPEDMAWQSGVLDAEAAFADRLQAARDLVFANDEGPQARRETAILLHLIDLRDLALASRLEVGPSPTQFATRRQAELTGRVVEQIAEALQVIAGHLRAGGGPVVDPAIEQAIHGLLDQLEDSARTDPCAAVAGVNHLLENKLAMLRSLQRLLEGDGRADLPCARSDLRRYITPDEWRLAAVTANLHADAPVLRHALRTCATATAAYALTRALPWAPHPQWIVLTILAVMQGNLALTLMRRNARVLGTLAGCVAVLVLTTAGTSTTFISACFLVASGIAHAYFGVRYSVTAAAAAVMALLQAHLAVPDSGFSTLERFADTVAGALLGWAATYALPIWERRNVGAALRQAIVALRAYAAEATALRDDSAGLPRFARQRAYDCIRTLAATRSRSLAEPADVRVPIPQLTAWLAAAYALMAQLSNLRLSLAMHAREHPTPAFAAAVARVSREVDALLAAGTIEPAPAAWPADEDERVLSAVPHLLPRARRTLLEAARVAAQAAQIEALIRPPADDAPPQPAAARGLAEARDDAR
ncbi:FUSC family protein [Scleromatobacter humisilvae]|uniref:FUSC family protein n=1 Tax=Scleromatobacter humisilvae TaxID=2897159 RepID=A0A9X1YMV7_9BURK|nr:FUSC family protein [Scleromatobacter humisilvae]MCK9687880.1 FUSC family protein [Scleromatobacter humisilvae]